MQQYPIYSRIATAKLQRALLDKSKLEINQVGFAKLLGIAIFTQTNDYVSETTIRRFFELVPGITGPSLAIMNMLSRYAGFDSWLDLEGSTSIENPFIGMPQSGSRTA